MPNINPAKFFGEVKAEMKKVTFPTKQETIRLTTIVITISLMVGVFIGGLDFAFTKMVELIVKK